MLVSIYILHFFVPVSKLKNKLMLLFRTHRELMVKRGGSYHRLAYSSLVDLSMRFCLTHVTKNGRSRFNA
jgi:hypothetical protein